MPRKGKATKACQTDTVFLSEDQVETIVSKRLSQEIERLKTELISTHSSRQYTNDKFEETLNQLNRRIANIQGEISLFKSSSEKLTNDVDSLNNLQQECEVSIEQLQEDVNSMEQKMEIKVDRQNVELKLDELQQHTKLNNLRIFGLNEEEDEDVTNQVIDFAKKKMRLEIRPDEIEARRMGPIQPTNPKPRDILIRFDNQSLRNTMYRKKKLLRDQNQQVYINEDLTMKRSFLFYQARKLRKQQRLFGVWTQAGNILVKISPDSVPKEVNSIEEINSLIQNNDSTAADTTTNSEVSDTTSYEDLP